MAPHARVGSLPLARLPDATRAPAPRLKAKARTPARTLVLSRLAAALLLD